MNSAACVLLGDAETMPRMEMAVTDLKLPMSILPRPGESVVWYSDSSRRRGTLLGHNVETKPVVRNEYGFTQPLGSFDEIRLADPSHRSGPNWTQMGEQARVFKPRPEEMNSFENLLGRRMPPGPAYIELIQEIWNRGFEVFVVGGTVRDVLAGQPTHDVDLVTSIPLAKTAPLLASMYRYEPSFNHSRGFVRLGGTPASGDPFIDLKAMVHSQPGTPNVIFSSDIGQDLRHRDFACNAIYYDPINKALIDPSGCGVSGAETKCLELVADPQLPPFYRAQICIRYFKFICRGFQSTQPTIQALQRAFFPSLASMKRSGVVAYFKAQVLSKSPMAEHPGIMQRFQEAMQVHDAEDLWVEHIEPVLEELIPGNELP